MALVKLPDGQVVDYNLIESVQLDEDVDGSPEVLVMLKGGRSVILRCESKEDAKQMLAQVHATLGV
jgi:hypothetical protein